MRTACVSRGAPTVAGRSQRRAAARHPESRARSRRRPCLARSSKPPHRRPSRFHGCPSPPLETVFIVLISVVVGSIIAGGIGVWYHNRNGGPIRLTPRRAAQADVEAAAVPVAPAPVVPATIVVQPGGYEDVAVVSPHPESDLETDRSDSVSVEDVCIRPCRGADADRLPGTAPLVESRLLLPPATVAKVGA